MSMPGSDPIEPEFASFWAPEDRPKPEAPPAAPTPEDPGTQVKLRQAEEEQRRVRGRASTIFAGLDSASTRNGNISRRTLLGY